MSSRLAADKVLAYLAYRIKVCAEAEERYDGKAPQAENDGGCAMYRRMATTERCVKLELMHVREVIAGAKADPAWKLRRQPVSG